MVYHATVKWYAATTFFVLSGLGLCAFLISIRLRLATGPVAQDV